MPEELLKLPLEIQLALAGGYAAYVISYVGIRESHTAVDVTFKSLAFSLIASGAYSLLHKLSLPQVLSIAISFVVCCLSGLLWRKYGRDGLQRCLRATDISWSDDDPSALASLLSNSRDQMSQMSVLLDDGTWLICEDLNIFANSPFGPCKLGTKGDVAMYITHIIHKPRWPFKAERRRQRDVKSLSWGDNISYIPASKIARVNFRHKRD